MPTVNTNAMKRAHAAREQRRLRPRNDEHLVRHSPPCRRPIKKTSPVRTTPAEPIIEREREDIFKAIFRSLLDGQSVSKDSTLAVEEFIAGVRARPEALELLATLGDIGSNRRHKALAAGEEEALRELFASMDTSNDGTLSWAEWSKYVGTRRSAITNKLFARLDAAGEGVVDAAAFVAAFEENAQLRLLHDLGRGSATMLLGMVDANGDGKITRQELAEFMAVVQSATPLKKPSRLGAR